MKIFDFIWIMFFIVIYIGILFIGAERIEKIENGEMTLVSESYMDR